MQEARARIIRDEKSPNGVRERERERAFREFLSFLRYVSVASYSRRRVHRESQRRDEKSLWIRAGQIRLKFYGKLWK